MSKGTYQNLTLIGRLGADPEIIDTKGDLSVAKLKVATADSVKRKGSDNWEDVTTWHHVTVFNQKANFAKTYLKKGDSVHVEAKLRPNKWEDKEGRERYTTDIIATDLQQVGRIDRSDSGEPKSTTSGDPLKDIE